VEGIVWPAGSGGELERAGDGHVGLRARAHRVNELSGDQECVDGKSEHEQGASESNRPAAEDHGTTLGTSSGT